MNKSKNKAIEYLRLFRLQTAAVTASTCLIGGLVMNQRDLFLLFVLFLVGLLYHIFGFVLNEYVDINVDNKSKDLKDKPLVSGSISKVNALFVVGFSSILACVLLVVFFQSIFSILFFAIALLLGGIYDVYGKTLFASDFVLAGGFFFLFLAGAATVSTIFPILVYICGILYFLQIVFNNAVEGGLKDIDHDALGGGRTLAIRLGVKEHLGKLSVSNSFLTFAFSLRVVFVIFLIFLGLQLEPIFWSQKYLVGIFLAVLFLLVSFVSMFKFLQNTAFDRGRLKRLFSFHEISSYSAFLIILYPLLGLNFSVFLILLPFFWFLLLNLALYGTLLEPRV